MTAAKKTSPAKKTAAPKTAKPAPAPVEKVTRKKAAPVAIDAAPVSAPKAEKKPKATKAEDERTITLLVKENPKRVGTKAWAKWELYKDGMTIAAFIAAGGKRSTIRWDLRHELIAVK